MGKVSVTVDDEHLEMMDTVADALRDSGMQVDKVLDTLGIITGSVPDGHHDSLSAIKGVASVSEDVEFQLPPPDSPVQ